MMDKVKEALEAAEARATAAEAALREREAELTAEIGLQDVRLMAGEGKLTGHDVLNACNAVLRTRRRAALQPEAPTGAGEA